MDYGQITQTSAPSASSSNAQDEGAADTTAPETPAEETTATLPSGLFTSAPKKGDVVTLRVVNVYDGEIEVAPETDPDQSTGGNSGMPANAELDKMATA